MRDVLMSLLAGLTSTLRTRTSLQFEILALRHRLASKRIPVLLEMEKPPGTDRMTGGVEGNPRPDRRHELRERDRVYGDALRTLAANVEITELLTAPRSPWQNPYVEGLIGSRRRECLDHVIVVNESSLRRQITCYLDCYHGSRSHVSLGKGSPEGRAVEPPSLGWIVAVPKVGGLHHR